ncbi:glucose-methanol-choline oxidoreductase [Mycena sp. CBHHK59/15]|nr:glucose-methanol-choline oxidoreductase [Mycena sp. CBHHK59/15]
MNSENGLAGASHFAGSVDPHGERSSVATAYLTDDVLSRANLTVSTSTLVAKILFDEAKGDEPRTSGVLLQCAKNGPLFSAAAHRQLLMLSGLGPATELQKHGVPVVRDLPLVGKDLLDTCTN